MTAAFNGDPIDTFSIIISKVLTVKKIRREEKTAIETTRNFFQPIGLPASLQKLILKHNISTI
ncbi:hypothetical protein ACQV2X_03670 [Facklamia sp. P12945]|uniref:hypothetical protein n=1 Tax=unclassified Facklamia TaxID=2622293 RepID=UPI003D17108F